MAIDLDFGKVGQIPRDGTYRFTVVKAKIKTNKAKDGRYINLQLALTDHPSDEDFEGHTVWDMTSLKKTGLWKTQEFLEAVTQRSWREDGMSLNENDDDELEWLHGETVMASCLQDVDLKEKPILKVQTYYPDDGTVEIEEATDSGEYEEEEEELPDPEAE